ncbi:HIT family protein [Alkalitalea saponilacus]|uniref:Histidine triad (HIT) family protein n=1 Tax=Alkalitalea saponilacus TaxID=889453 RepID=A0A1T5A7H0_9BACT|nr:HIT family protein [Alkalitalea saponilacus]ASB48815.1 HIT family protein [Alkalitalea saponilacus]SKB30951.1 histidine triad (HIT) family protein [Alkalitalea saponilacus]
MASIFTKIINGEIPSFKIAEDERYVAFLDITPLAKGHTLVVPKKEVDYIFDLEDDLLQGMIVFSKKVAKAIEKSIECKRIGIAVIGLEVPHAHVHLVPLQTVADLSFSKPKLKLSNEEMEQIAAAIKENIN